jgi:hypothetical protein
MREDVHYGENSGDPLDFQCCQSVRIPTQWSIASTYSWSPKAREKRAGRREKSTRDAAPLQDQDLRPGFAAGGDEDVRGKFEAETEFANLIQSELALTGKKHGDGTFRTEFRD